MVPLIYFLFSLLISSTSKKILSLYLSSCWGKIEKPFTSASFLLYPACKPRTNPGMSLVTLQKISQIHPVVSLHLYHLLHNSRHLCISLHTYKDLLICFLILLLDLFHASFHGKNSCHGILQASILEWVAISFSRGSSWHRGRTRVS